MSRLSGFLACLILLAGGTAAAQPAPDALKIVQAVDANERMGSTRSEARQIITTSSGQERTLEMDMFSKDMNDKQLTVYTGPARVRGDKILMLNDGDDIWFYTPKTDRVRHLASHARKQKVQGSDFSYEDFSTGHWEEDFTHTLLGDETIDGVDCWHLSSVPTDSGPSYARIESWIDKARSVALRVDYFDDEGLLKRLTASDVRQIDGHWVPFGMLMTNLRDGGKTLIEMADLEVDVELSDNLFTTNSLKRR